MKVKYTFTWFVNAVGQTMSVVRGPVQFVSGSPPWSTDRSATETLQRVTIDHHFAISSKEVTVAQYEQFVTDEPEVGTIQYPGVLSSQPDLPRNAVHLVSGCRLLQLAFSEIESAGKRVLLRPRRRRR